jgi:hypothetical protein
VDLAHLLLEPLVIVVPAYGRQVFRVAKMGDLHVPPESSDAGPTFNAEVDLASDQFYFMFQVIGMSPDSPN